MFEETLCSDEFEFDCPKHYINLSTFGSNQTHESLNDGDIIDEWFVTYHPTHERKVGEFEQQADDSSLAGAKLSVGGKAASGISSTGMILNNHNVGKPGRILLVADTNKSWGITDGVDNNISLIQNAAVPRKTTAVHVNSSSSPSTRPQKRPRSYRYDEEDVSSTGAVTVHENDPNNTANATSNVDMKSRLAQYQQQKRKRQSTDFLPENVHENESKRMRRVESTAAAGSGSGSSSAVISTTRSASTLRQQPINTITKPTTVNGSTITANASSSSSTAAASAVTTSAVTTSAVAAVAKTKRSLAAPTASSLLKAVPVTKTVAKLQTTATSSNTNTTSSGSASEAAAAAAAAEAAVSTLAVLSQQQHQQQQKVAAAAAAKKQTKLATTTDNNNNKNKSTTVAAVTTTTTTNKTTKTAAAAANTTTTRGTGKGAAAASAAAASSDIDMVEMLKKHNSKFAPKHTYEPPRHSVRDVRKWEKISEKTWATLKPEEREVANEEIARLKSTNDI